MQANGAWRFAGGSLGDGAKVLTARSIDLAGNISAQSLPISIFIDTAAPQFTFSQLPPTLVTNDKLQVTGRVGDGLSRVASASYQLGDGRTANLLPNAQGEFALNVDVRSIAEGDHW